MTEVTIITNSVPRYILDAYELTVEERAEFDYLDWQAIERGEDSSSFFRYKGEIYDLGDIPAVDRRPNGDSAFQQWDGVAFDSFFSGILVRYVDDFERVIVGRFYS
ncbi:MAG: hypothetical protein H0U59_10760 [Gemmatimonadaceae bacterium]|nr:hypothetical protein [Gemmatimonadaceae bacterium]